MAVADTSAADSAARRCRNGGRIGRWLKRMLAQIVLQVLWKKESAGGTGNWLVHHSRYRVDFDYRRRSGYHELRRAPID